MRAIRSSVLVLCAALGPLVAVACVHEERRIVARPEAREDRAPGVTALPPQYVVADPSGSKALRVALGPAQQGLVIDRRRVVVGRGEPRVAVDLAPEAIVGASRIPGRFGGGFLFWTTNTLYRSDAFESALKPVSAKLIPAISLDRFYRRAASLETEVDGLASSKEDR